MDNLGCTLVAEDVDVGSGKLGPLLQKADEVKERILQSLEIKEWGLFDG